MYLYLQIKNKFVYLQSQKNKVVHFFRGCGVIGSHARLRIWCREAWGFESLHPHSCENSSVGRAQPCQGWGRGFESRFSLHSMPWWWNW